MEKKYDNILTVILVIAIAATLVLTGFWIYDTYTKNKVDNDALAAIEEFNNQIAQNQQNTIEEPEENIEDIFRLNEADFDTVTVANERQKNCIGKSLESIESAISSLKIGEMLDAVNILIDEAEQSLLQLTGEKVTDAVVDEVFSRFCVGK